MFKARNFFSRLICYWCCFISWVRREALRFPLRVFLCDVSLQMDAKLPLDIFENVMQLAIEGCKAIANYIREVRESQVDLLLVKKNMGLFILKFDIFCSCQYHCSEFFLWKSWCHPCCVSGVIREYQATRVPSRSIA